MHGVIFTKEGKKVTLNIGENENDPVFCVTDLLPHLAKDQMTKKMIDGIEGENLNILIGGMPVKSEDVSEKVKFAILKYLNEKYGITERDFLSAEIEIVPAFKAKNVGLDESFVGAYGQDDRVCAFTTLKGIFAVQNPKKTALAILVDKEEIGSTGNTGMLSAFFEMTLAEVIEKINGNCTITDYNTTIENSACLSSDVGAAVDPNYESVYEKRNAAFAGCGMVLMKYTGARGKSESSDASAEFVYEIGKILDDNGVIWQRLIKAAAVQSHSTLLILIWTLLTAVFLYFQCTHRLKLQQRVTYIWHINLMLHFIITDSRNEPVDKMSTDSFCFYC